MQTPFEQQTAAQFDRWARWYDAILGRFYFRWIHEQAITLGQSLFSSAVFHDPVIVDLACGTGLMLEKLSHAFPTAVLHGIDISSGMLYHAHKRLDNNPRIHLHKTSAWMMPFPPQSVHLLFCIDAFHHFDEPQKVMCEIARVLHPRGMMILIDPAIETIAQKIIFRTIGKLVDHQFHFYTASEITKTFSAKNLNATHNGFYFFNNVFIIRHNATF